MHVLIAPDCFTGTLTATQAAEAIAQGWRRSAPHDLLTLLPLSDGGPGFLDVVAAAVPGESIATTVTDPLGRQVPAAVLVTESDGRRTAWVESAQAVGLHLLDESERDPAVTTSAGLGLLLRAALSEGVDRLVVGLGGSGTNDAGAGMLAALAGVDNQVLTGGGLGLGATGADDCLAAIERARAALAGVELVVATDVDVPLLGLDGASATFAPQKGASPELAQQLEASLGHYASVVATVSPPPTDLMTGRPRRLDREPGAGAAGGIGYGLLTLGGHRVSGVETTLTAVGVDQLLAAADLVITGEGSLDWQSRAGKVAAGVCEAAARHATPVVIIAGRVLLGRREAMAMGASGVYAVAERLDDVDASLLDPVGSLADRAARVAATWSPQR
ncbi:glycerate kinase [Marihabitans asiaticum]|uniref:Glycerate kinase n=1 Tax=Marihabitans asiaticum TaxID=415218 RepID=A0A560W708_9MICO|nr:glycerate kinase [Marihabitans asiaticum]TWD13398.1 glycerate kinase [Marihabitans asiaticum]